MNTPPELELLQATVPNLIESVHLEEQAIEKLLEAHAAGDGKHVDQLIEYIGNLRSAPVWKVDQ